MSAAVVVGGGISGLCACRLLTNHHDKVILVEKEQVLGGLLKSQTNNMGHVFDLGTHFISGTTIPELNDLLFADLDLDKCHEFVQSMPVGSYFDGTLFSDSDCINIRTLPQHVHNRCVVELLNSVPNDAASLDLKDYLVKNYGPTITERIFAPIVKKFAGTDLQELDPDAVDAFSINRLVVLDRFASTQLKQSRIYDKKVAWAHRDDGSSTIPKWYPKSEGAGAWVKSLEKRVRADGVEILTGCCVESVRLKDGKAQALVLDNGNILECNEAVWTVPPVSFLKAAGIKFNKAPPRFRNIVLLNYSFDAEICTDLHCVINYDPDCISFRITLFPNITNDKRVPAPHHLTVEVLIDDYNVAELACQVFSELKHMGIVPEQAKILSKHHIDIRPGWPILTTGFKKTAQDAIELAQESASNVIFVGRGKDHNSHFMYMVLEDLYRALTES